MNPLIKKALVAIVVLAIAAASIKAFQSNFEYIEDTEWLPLTGEAKTNPLYASKLFLRRMGIPTETIESTEDLTQLPNTDTAILISATRNNLREPEIAGLLQWVRQGGHLIIAGLSDWMFLDDDLNLQESNDPLQSFLEVDVLGSIKFDGDTPASIVLKGSERPLLLGAYHYPEIVLKQGKNQSGIALTDINGKNFMIRQTVESGQITLVSDLEFIDNYNIADYDHAEILWQLVKSKSAVWLVHSDNTNNLMQIIWQHFWALVISLSVLLLAWMLRVSRRFGPVIDKERDDRRDLMEHIDASGRFYWKQQDFNSLLVSTRNAAQQQLSKRIPGWHAMQREDQIALLSNRLSISESALSKALYAEIGNSPHQFTETIKQLEHIRISL